MPKDATVTRELLIRAGEGRFARDGVAAARLRDVVRDAGQANDSAVGYHFGSREGLLEAIVRKHLAVMDVDRTLPTRRDGLRELVGAIVRPTAMLLDGEDGRDFLRIMEQLSSWSGLGSGQPVEILHGTRLETQLRALLRRLTERLGAALARERAALLATFLTAALASRARAIDAGGRLRMSNERWVEQLIDSLHGALVA